MPPPARLRDSNPKTLQTSLRGRSHELASRNGIAILGPMSLNWCGRCGGCCGCLALAAGTAGRPGQKAAVWPFSHWTAPLMSSGCGSLCVAPGASGGRDRGLGGEAAKMGGAPVRGQRRRRRRLEELRSGLEASNTPCGPLQPCTVTRRHAAPFRRKDRSVTALLTQKRGGQWSVVSGFEDVHRL